MSNLVIRGVRGMMVMIIMISCGLNHPVILTSLVCLERIK